MSSAEAENSMATQNSPIISLTLGPTSRVHTQHLVGVGVGQDLGEAFGLMVDLGAAVGGEGELADLL